MSLDGHDLGEERNHLSSLMRDFPGGEISDVDEAIHRLQTTYQILYDGVTVFAPNLDAKTIPFQSRLFHTLLYRGILSNAGQYGQVHEPNVGYVGFGGMSQAGPPKYQGVHPTEITAEMDKATQNLIDADDPIAGTAIFYYEMSAIHPFYDANSRIGSKCRFLYFAS